MESARVKSWMNGAYLLVEDHSLECDLPHQEAAPYNHQQAEVPQLACGDSDIANEEESIGG